MIIIQPQNRLRFAIIALLLLAWAGEGCISLHGEEREVIDAREILNSEENIANCLRVSLQRGNVGLARSIVGLYDSQHEKVMVKVLEQQLWRLKQLQGEIVQSESTVEPVAKWGQNETHLFLSLKMSHRWDSPPCLNTKRQNAFSSSSHFNYTNLCLVSNSKITFSFLLSFYDEVVHPIAVSGDGVGIYSAIIEKQQPKIWPFLSRDEKIYPIWAEISQRHNAAHKEYQTLLDGIVRARRSKPVVLEEKKPAEDEKTESSPPVPQPETAPAEQPQSSPSETSIQSGQKEEIQQRETKPTLAELLLPNDL